jgi:hypothetical protein
MTQELIEFKVGSLTLQEPMALITNWMMSLFSLYAFFKLKKTNFEEVVLWRKFFFWFTITSFFGGLGHLFFQQLGVPGKYPNWITSVLAGFYAGFAMLFNFKSNFLKSFLIIKGISLLLLSILFQKFIFIAVDAILTYIIYCGIIGYKLTKSISLDYKFMYLGVLVCIPSVFIFLLQLNPHKWLNKDDLSHLLMLFCLIFFYLGANARSKSLLGSTNVNLAI